MSEPAKTTDAPAAAADKKTFIVTLKEKATGPAVDKFKQGIKSLGGTIEHEYTLIKGYVVKLPSFHAASVKKDPTVESVEEDKTVKINSA